MIFINPYLLIDSSNIKNDDGSLFSLNGGLDIKKLSEDFLDQFIFDVIEQNKQNYL
jgi:hypothetical protein